MVFLIRKSKVRDVAGLDSKFFIFKFKKSHYTPKTYAYYPFSSPSTSIVFEPLIATLPVWDRCAIEAEIVAVGGYLLQNVKGERRYKIVNTKHVRLIMTEDEQQELEAEYLSDESELVDTSKSLFEYLLPEPKLFFEQSEPSATKAVSNRTSAACKKISKTELVITIMYKNNKKKYVRYSDALGDLTFTNPMDLFIDALETNNLPCHLLFDIEGLVFTKADSNMIERCYLSKDF